MSRNKGEKPGISKTTSQKRKGEEGFEGYFSALFGERWSGLREALLGRTSYATLASPLLEPYYLDRASLLPARALPVVEAGQIVDLCAAPGGKALDLAVRMGANSRLLVNERSRNRLARLRRVLDDHLPQEIRERVEIFGHDGALWGSKRPGAADAVLCDVPCSSEAHLLASQAHLAQWSFSRIRRLAGQAVGLLASAFDSLTPGGVVVYSTCALSQEENDHVVARVLDRRGAQARLYRPGPGELREIAEGVLAPELIEETELGYQILPDRSGGSGPIYFTRLRKEG
ncbi:MAG: hypothetical protein ACOCWS_04480 [Alkalispirochaetaceae bacterium]